MSLHGIDLDAKPEQRLSAPPKEEAHLWMLVTALDTTDGANSMAKRWVKKDKPTLEFEEDLKIRQTLKAKKQAVEMRLKQKQQQKELEDLLAQEAELDKADEVEIKEIKKESKKK